MDKKKRAVKTQKIKFNDPKMFEAELRADEELMRQIESGHTDSTDETKTADTTAESYWTEEQVARALRMAKER